MGIDPGFEDRPWSHLEWTMGILAELFEAETGRPCLPYRTPEELSANFDLAIPEPGKTAEELYALARQVVLATPRTAGRTFFNQLFGGRVVPALAGDILASALNNSVHTYKAAGLQVLVERSLISELARQVGYPHGEGILTPGGSLSNLVAMMLARNEALPDVRDEGLRGARLTAYASDQSHYSLRKNAGILGTGRKLVRIVPTDDAGHFHPGALEEQIRRDQDEGCTPFFVNATAGTTVLGAFDPLPPLVEICRRYGLWLHVDAAYGGSVALSPRFRHLLEGCGDADSLTWDLHKMMGVPVGASAILLREEGLLARHLSETASYLFQSEEDAFNPGLRSPQCGRRNDALKCWMAFQALGRAGYARRVERQFELARWAAERVKRDPKLELVLEPESINVCFRVSGRPAREVCSELDRRGLAKVAWGAFRDQEFVRLVCVNADLTEADLEAFFQAVLE